MPRASPSEAPTQVWLRSHNLARIQSFLAKASRQIHWALTHEPSSLTSATHLSRLLFPLVMIRKAVATTTVRRPRGPWFHGLVALFKGWKKNRPTRSPTVPVGLKIGNQYNRPEPAGTDGSAREMLAACSHMPTANRQLLQNVVLRF